MLFSTQKRNTCTSFFWPMRCARSMACTRPPQYSLSPGAPQRERPFTPARAWRAGRKWPREGSAKARRRAAGPACWSWTHAEVRGAHQVAVWWPAAGTRLPVRPDPVNTAMQRTCRRPAPVKPTVRALGRRGGGPRPSAPAGPSRPLAGQGGGAPAGRPAGSSRSRRGRQCRRCTG